MRMVIADDAELVLARILVCATVLLRRYPITILLRLSPPDVFALKPGWRSFFKSLALVNQIAPFIIRRVDLSQNVYAILTGPGLMRSEQKTAALARVSLLAVLPDPFEVLFFNFDCQPIVQG